jgi:glycosyltransferase involved in cell wall biosynthesis
MSALSIIIPTYNSSHRLAQSLQTIARRDEVEIAETVVVDDGSDDDTRSIADSFQAQLPSLRYVFRPRDASSGRARARNLGLEAATAPRVLFLDAGVIPGPGLLRAALAPDGNERRQLVIHRTIGLFTRTTGDAEPSADRLLAQANELAVQREWRDVREPYMTTDLNGRLELPAAWLFAWTCALSVPRADAVAIGGFDDAFLGWGAEDVDFAARLVARGVEVAFRGDAMAIHLPHHAAAQQKDDHARNARQLHAKLCNRETELFSVWQSGFRTNAFAVRLDTLRLGQVASPCGVNDIGHAVRAGERVLGVGLHWDHAPPQLEPAVVLAHNGKLAEQLSARYPRAAVHGLLGVALPYGDGHFERAIVGDLLRLLPPDLARAELSEIARVSLRVSLIAGIHPGHEEKIRGVLGWSWLSLDDLRRLAQDCGLAVASSKQANADTHVFELERAG